MKPRALSALVVATLVVAAAPAEARTRACSGPAVRGSATGVDIGGPEIATGFASKDVVATRTVMAVASNPLASRAACDVLVAGGSAVDAAVAALAVLSLVEPQATGIGGGGYLVHFDAKTGIVDTYDGRETAPAASGPDDLRYVDAATDRTLPRPNPRASGRSIGVPGVLRMLEAAHAAHGRHAWLTLFAPAIRLARGGFPISPRMAASIDHERVALARDDDARAYFLRPDGSGKPAGTLLKNDALATTLDAIARGGPDAFYRGPIARDLVAKARDANGITPSKLALDDLAAYRARRADPVCAPYRDFVVCGMGPSSSGGITVAATLGILSNFDLASRRPTPIDRDGGRPQLAGAHLIAEAERLAYADRDKYVADTAFVALPGGNADALLDPAYLRRRAGLIDPTRSMGRAQAGEFGRVALGVGDNEEHGTSNLVVVDRDGNVVAMTTTVEAAFGSFHMVDGFLLNNQLTDFSFTPVDANGAPIANRLQANKRPRSSMAPTLVFRRNADGSRGDFVLATGSAGGPLIILDVVKTLVGLLDWGLDPQQAASLVDFGALNLPTTFIGGEHPDVDATNDGANDPLVRGLRGLGHTVVVTRFASGVAVLMRTTIDGKPAWLGGADPRREGVVMGDVVERASSTLSPPRPSR